MVDLDEMTDQGYNVFWNEWSEELGKSILQRRHFNGKPAADAFARSLPPESKARVFEAAHTSNKEWDAIGRDNTDVLNRRSLVELMREYNITLPAKQFDKWRPTVRKTGRISGISDGLECIMTDGLLGYFLRGDKEPLYGHVGWFIWDQPDITIIPNPNYRGKPGEKKFITIVKDRGCPSTLHKRPRRVVAGNGGEPRPKVKKVHVPMTAQAALDLIERMTNGAMR